MAAHILFGTYILVLRTNISTNNIMHKIKKIMFWTGHYVRQQLYNAIIIFCNKNNTNENCNDIITAINIDDCNNHK